MRRECWSLSSPIKRQQLFYFTRPAIPPGITATAAVVLYILRERFPRPPPRMLFHFERYTQYARTTFYRCFESLVWVESLLGSANNPAAAHLFLDGYATRKVAYAAQRIVQCLAVLQGAGPRAQRCCLRSNRAPVPNAQVEENTQVLEVSSSRVCGGSKLVRSALVLPPATTSDPPMLCAMHFYEFQFYLYKVINPSWPVPHLAEDAQIFGPIRVVRWSPATNSFEYEDQSS